MSQTVWPYLLYADAEPQGHEWSFATALHDPS